MAAINTVFLLTNALATMQNVNREPLYYVANSHLVKSLSNFVFLCVLEIVNPFPNGKF